MEMLYVHASDIYRIVRTWIHVGVWMEMLYVHGSDTCIYQIVICEDLDNLHVRV